MKPKKSQKDEAKSGKDISNDLLAADHLPLSQAKDSTLQKRNMSC